MKGRQLSAEGIWVQPGKRFMMSGSIQVPGSTSLASLVPAGHDLFDEQRGLGISDIALKLSMQDGRLLILENSFRERGGPPRHLHHVQDEWFYAIEGEFIMEVGQERTVLRPGDSLLAPRGVPHVWAFTGGGIGRILIAFSPAGDMERFFREVMKANAMPPQDPELWRSYGLELVGPPLRFDGPGS